MSDNDENADSSESTSPEPKEVTMNVKITNPEKKEVKWNDDRDDMEYDEIILTKEDMDI